MRLVGLVVVTTVVPCLFFLLEPPPRPQQQRMQHPKMTKAAIPEPDAAPAVEPDPPSANNGLIIKTSHRHIHVSRAP